MNAATGRTGGYTLISGQTNNTIDAGFYQWGMIGDWVWFDANLDGIQDIAETNGISNLPVVLLDAASNVLATTVTSTNGTYLFDHLVPGDYIVRFDLSAIISYSWITTSRAGTNNAVDSDAIAVSTNGLAWTEVLTLTSGQTNLDIDLGVRPQKSTRAEVAGVWGEWRDGTGYIGWQTESEWGTAGFVVYRVDPGTEAETRLNEAAIPAALEEVGSVYELSDPAAREGTTGTYRLEELEFSGNILDLGTHEVTFGSPPAAAKAARAEMAAAKVARSLAKPVAQSTVKVDGPSSMLKVLFRKEGIYGVSFQAIADGMGLARTDVQALAAANGLSLTMQGEPVPTIYDAAGDRLLFHGRATTNWYTRDNAVMITAGAGLAMPRRDPGAGAGESVLPVTVRFEEDRYPFDSALEKPQDFYYWDYVIGGTNATSSKDFSLDLTGCTGNVDLKVRLMGWSSSTNDPDHSAEFRFNGTVVGATTFDGAEAEEVGLAIPAGLISNGVNTLTVKGYLLPGRTYSAFVVDWIEASFTRMLAPLTATAFCEPGEVSAVSAANFTEPLVLALDANDNPSWIADEDGSLPEKAWTVSPADKKYAAIEAAAVPMLSPQVVEENPWFLAATNRIDYLVITSRALQPAAQGLADYRANQGLRTGVATFEDICDWMTDGLRTPEAIPELLRYARATWTETPWMVVLAGNGNYDYLGALSNEVNHVPPMMLSSYEGLFAADGLLTDLDGDMQPDVALGRLPALTTNDLTAMVAKIKAYEQDFGSTWENQLVLAADTNDTAAGNFAAANSNLAALAGTKYPVAKIELDAVAITPARTALTNWFKTGAGFIHYTGHGGVNTWSGKQLLKAADVNVMTNTRKPVVVALSCLVGRYEAPGVDSLGELLLRRTQGGAAAVWGPSGLSRNSPATELGEAFYRTVLQQGAGTLGLAIQQARRSMAADVVTKDTFAIYNLLGDPALRIAGNTSGQPTDENFAQWRWQRFSPQALTNAAISGATSVNFSNYAWGSDNDPAVEAPEFGYSLSDNQTGFILRWKRRIQHEDIDYQLWLSPDLQAWESRPADLHTLGVESDPDGIMETVRTKIDRPDSIRVFLGIKAVRK